MLCGILGSILIGLIAASIVVLPKLSALKPVRMQQGAADYTVKDSLKFSENRDVFLGRKVEKTPVQKNNSSTSPQKQG